jgi:hypothetical protein
MRRPEGPTLRTCLTRAGEIYAVLPGLAGSVRFVEYLRAIINNVVTTQRPDEKQHYRSSRVIIAWRCRDNWRFDGLSATNMDLESDEDNAHRADRIGNVRLKYICFTY